MSVFRVASMAGMLACAFAITACSGQSVLTTAQSPAEPSASSREHATVRNGPTAEQRARTGVDARAECTSATARAYIADELGETDPHFVRGFRSDDIQRQKWSAEASGSEYRESRDPNAPVVKESHVLCWWTGSFSVSVPDENGNVDRDYRHIVLSIPVDGTRADPIVMISRNQPIPVWAPPAQ